MALKLTGAAAKNFALFVYAVLKDQKKVRGKTRLVRMLREQRPFMVGLKFHPIYKGQTPDSTGPVLTAVSVEPAEKPVEDVVMFS